ncbi:class I SAM-dependent methyltransferase [Streptomyces sp. MMG1121]|uniref:class I SAM-dependent methyltransferase n=1 Tax=Streptomyces sp. MMG1121 TaxID=1415544 RepID=UPI0006AF37BE|nr:class I SAM-dependent methyltransferase [Streptomyces sp. MMG1121]KOV66299.1 SAM-dependent methyltransferase [Streptomyces sp. MMG1121]
MSRLVEALHRFNADHPWDHNAHYHRWLLRQLPRRVGRVLDVGCGSGDLVRLLAGRAESVVGADAEPRMLEEARRLTDAAAPVTYALASAPHGLPAGPYDVITCVAVLHHLPCADALTRFRRELAPGGTLVVVGCARPKGVLDHAIGLAAVPLNMLTGWVKNRGRATARRPVSMTAPTRDPELTLTEIGREARRILPGARLRRRLFWRYTLLWRAPVSARAS